MKNLVLPLTTLIFVLILSACDINEPLNKQPLDQVPEDALWEDPALIEAYLNEIYLGMGHGLHENMLSSLSDESHFIHNYGSNDIVQANISPSNMGAYEDFRFGHFIWGDIYSDLRDVNIFLSEIDEANIEDEELRDRMKGEAHFLRAYMYHNLMRFRGGVPIVTEVFDLDDDMEVPRSSFEETVDFIVEEAETAADLLPTVQSGDDLGRASGAAALALKSRVLLYAASDLYHDNPSGEEFTGYTSSQDRTAMWQEAKDAAEDVMELGEFDLFRADPADGDSTALNYYELFLQNTSEEAIMSRFFIQERGDDYNPGLHNGPNGYHNWAGNTPIQNLVDDYRMDDGSEFDWDDPDHAADPYEDRDPRFYATILYDGAEWRTRPDDVIDVDPDGIIQTFTEIESSGNPGVDTRDSHIEDWNGSFSRYYLRKFIDENVEHSSSVKQEVPWIFFRYAEVLLNYAEASIELGGAANEDDAREVLNQIRRRAGMPEFDITVTGDDLMEEYRNERRIEMAFEEQRYFDVRRWMIAPDVLGEDAHGINIYIDDGSRSDRSSYSGYTYEVNEGIQSRDWDDKMYFAPISEEEMNRNSELEQNPGY